MKAEIKEKCPFCGNDSKDEFAVSSETMSGSGASALNVFNVCCPCGAEGPDGDTDEEAVARWNRRQEMEV
jgi:hypothetical protein